MEYAIEVRRTAERPTAVVAEATTWEAYPSVWRRLSDEVYAFLRESGVHHGGHNVLLCKDDVPNVEIGVLVAGPFTGGGRVVLSALPAGAVATTLHRGPYEGLPAAHQAVREWSAREGRQMAGPFWEIYGDWHDDPAELETEVYYLLR